MHWEDAMSRILRLALWFVIVVAILKTIFSRGH